MPQPALKLKQASAVLKVEPKELQNLVQFEVVKPKWVDGAISLTERRFSQRRSRCA